ncbi:hypothetical protein [Piscibacillus salipiscarius]|uniref:hypothetical protein n=1 Tax=Piscibacillus salipiscarius TaxID=299480 RepID=UPI0006D15978|nr:hypothetical protein [Piscibacillus salipiscarius]
MLNPGEDRLNYSKKLIPPESYELDFAMGTTFSLDLEALVGVPLALSLSSELDDFSDENPYYMLEALRKSADKFAIFCEGGQIQVPQNANSIFSLMENSVFEVMLPNNKSFHPKVWLIKYVNSEGESLFRLIVLSRNLTFDRSWDVAVNLEGKLTKQKWDKNKPLIDFFNYINTHSNPDKSTKIQSLLNELEYVEFQTDKNYPDFEFMPLGINGYEDKHSNLFDTYHDLLVISPFLTNSMLQKLNDKSLSNPSKTLITRRSELAGIDEELFEEFDIYVLKDLVVEGEGSLSEEQEELEQSQFQDIHAKFYARSKYTWHEFYIGSANLTNSAYYGNVEFLLKLQYRKRGFRIQELIEDIIGEDELESPFEKAVKPDQADETEMDLTEELERKIKELTRVERRASIVEHDDGYELKLTFDSLPEDVTFKIGSINSKKDVPLEHEVSMENLSLLELSQFFRVTAMVEDKEVKRIIKIPIEGLPDDRVKAIFKSIIQDKYTFLKYVAFLLDDEFLLSMIEEMERKRSGKGRWDDAYSDYPVIYENMLNVF